ncbi:MAG: hypothetical protein Q9174_004963 [Haloplaca sp. 1 TL-2023]
MGGDRLTGKVAVVTGSSSGLGRAIAIAFASEGAAFVLCADLEPIAKGSEFGAEEAGVPTHQIIQARHGESKAMFQQTNVTIGSDVERLVQIAVSYGGRLDIMVNNAGIGGTEHHGMVHEMTEETWDNTM